MRNAQARTEPASATSAFALAEHTRHSMNKALLCLIAGITAVPGFSPGNWGLLSALSCCVVFHFWLKCTSPRQAALFGYAYGLGLFGAGASWVYVSLHEFGMMPAPLAAAATLFFCAYLSLFPALAGSLQARLDLPLVPRLFFLIPAFGLTINATFLFIEPPKIRNYIFGA